MRITTQMLNESARKAGLPVNNVSLLNYVNNTSNNSTLAGALNKKKTENTSSVQKTNYEKLEKETENLAQTADIFTSHKEDNIFAKARESESTKEIYDNAKKLIEQYNASLEALEKASSSLNDYYSQMLTEAVSDNKEALESIGITQAKDGSLSLDKEMFNEADVDALEKVLGTGSDFTAKVSFLAGRISDNAKANAQSVSVQYDASGNMYSSLLSKYDFMG